MIQKTVLIDDENDQHKVNVQSQDCEFMEVDRVGSTNEHVDSPSVKHSSTSDTQLVNINQGLFMDIDEYRTGEATSPSQLALQNHHPVTDIVPRGRVDHGTYPDVIGTSIIPARRQRTLPSCEQSNAIVPYHNNDQVDQEGDNRESKRLRLMYEQANSAIETPATYEEALQSSEAVQWKDAIASEFKSLDEMKTWKLVDSPCGQKVIGCKWFFFDQARCKRCNSTL